MARPDRCAGNADCPPALLRRVLTLSGTVQGVGFRPFVYRLAQELGLAGSVQNLSGSVTIEVEGDAASLEIFRRRLIDDAPPLARPRVLACRELPPTGAGGFSILESRAGATDIHLPPDTAPCPDCLAELRDPADRRHRYPFINCTHCGPRYTLIEALPYDRARTSMAGFPLCPDCRAEYDNPLDRRFHAEPIACPVCGPQLAWKAAAATATGEAALAAALAALWAGGIVAVRGVGGYHLVCDARNEAAVASLRERKQRPARPFALLFANADDLAASDEELALLQSPQRPIVLVEARIELAPSVAPGLNRIGAMLAYSPLHALLLDDFGGPLVATSGNLSGEPIVTDPAEAEVRLGQIADGFLHHDRPIVRPAEDSVWQCQPGHGPVPLRLGRGSAPLELRLPQPLARPTLALGGEQKITLALGWGDRAVISPHIGDLDHPESLNLLRRVAADFCRLYQVRPEQLAIDAHPGFQSRRWAQSQGLPIREIWHHHAHASALAAEHPQVEDWLVVAWDGVGFGPDGTLWGGEVLRGRPGCWRRVASLRPFRLPGGEAAGREPWRSAAGLLWEGGADAPCWHPQQALLRAAWQKRINSPMTSAAGRLFDAAAALVGVCTNASFEGEGPMRLQALAESVKSAPDWPVRWRQAERLFELDWQPWPPLLQDAAIDPARRARAFHQALARAVAELPKRLGLPDAVPLGLVGGVFQNRLLVSLISTCVQERPVRLPRRIPPNDAGLAFGQLVEACLATN